MRISVQRHANIRVPHNLLQRLRVHARLCHIGTKSMTADMRCHLWHFGFVYFIIFLTDMLEILFPVQGDHWHSIFVQIQKAHFPVYHGFCLWIFAVLNDFLRKHFFTSSVMGTSLVPHSVFVSSMTYSIFRFLCN